MVPCQMSALLSVSRSAPHTLRKLYYVLLHISGGTLPSLPFTCSLSRKPSCRAFCRSSLLEHSKVHRVRAACSCNCTGVRSKERYVGEMYSFSFLAIPRLSTSQPDQPRWAIRFISGLVAGSSHVSKIRVNPFKNVEASRIVHYTTA